MRLIWIRHGETDWNRKGCYLGHLDVPLNQTGKQQARQAAEQLGNVLGQFMSPNIFPSMFSSDLTRCVETATIISEALFESDVQPIPSRSLRELNFGDWDGKTYKELYNTERERLETWYANLFTGAPPNGETLLQLGARVDGFLTELMKNSDPDTTSILVSHGGTIRWFQSRWILQDASQFWQVKQIPNGGMLCAEWDKAADTWTLKEIG